MEKFVFLGIVGKIGSGKDVISDYLIEKHDFQSLRLSDAVTDELNILGLDVNRKSRQEMGEKLRKEFGENILMRRLMKRVGGNCLFNGIRHPEEAEFLRKEGGYIIFVSCKDEIRFERAKKRDNVDWDKFLIIDNRDSEKLIEDIKGDFIVENNSDLDSLYKQVEKILEKIKKV